MVAYIPLLTRGWLFFKPIRMNLTYLVRYRVVGEQRKVLSQVITSALDVRPPLRSVVLGSIFGSLLGTGAKYAQQLAQVGDVKLADIISHGSVTLVQLVGAAIMSSISAVALSRKSGAQSFITVEDFFGGFVIGVLIGYQGSAYFENVLGRVGPTQLPPVNPPH